MARICIITPGHLSTNPRVVKEADAFSDAGHDVRVIAADFAGWARTADQEFSGRRWSSGRKISFGPLAPLPSRIKQVARQRVARRLVDMGWNSDRIDRAAVHPIGPDLASAARRVPADLYVAHYVAALPAAAYAARINGARYAFDAEDFHLGDLPDLPQHAFAKRLIRAIEGRYLAECAYVTAASPGIADAYAATYGIARPTVVLNTFPRSRGTDAPTPGGSASMSPSVYWFSQTIGPDRGLECAVRAIAIAESKPHLFLRGTPASGFIERLRAIAKHAGVDDRLHFLPPAVPSQMERLASEYDIGLSSEPGFSRNNCLALGNKLFSYLLAGLPILMAGVPAHQMFASEISGAAQVYGVDNENDLATAMDVWLRNRTALATARRIAWDFGQKRFNWECEQVRLLEILPRF